jgi:hypothetical protein
MLEHLNQPRTPLYDQLISRLEESLQSVNISESNAASNENPSLTYIPNMDQPWQIFDQMSLQQINYLF